MILLLQHYFCYSKPLADFLFQRGHRIVTRAINPKTKHLFWLYVVTEQLSKDLKEWSKNKPE